MTDLPVILKPKYVNPRLQGPLLYPLSKGELTAQPLWGNTVRLFYGAQDRFLPTDKIDLILKPRKIKDHEGTVIALEPDGGSGTSYVALYEFVAKCYHAGWTWTQTEELLDQGQKHGPSAQYRYQMLKHQGDTQWLADMWLEVIKTESKPYYVKQSIKGIREHVLQESTLMPLMQESSFTFHPEPLDGLRRWLAEHPGLSQVEVKSQQTVLKSPKIVVPYLEELARLGLASHTIVKGSGKGRPRKVWSAEFTLSEKQAKADALANVTNLMNVLLPSLDQVPSDN